MAGQIRSWRRQEDRLRRVVGPTLGVFRTRRVGLYWLYLRHDQQQGRDVDCYWRLVCSIRVDPQVIQQTVAHLGELDNRRGPCLCLWRSCLERPAANSSAGNRKHPLSESCDCRVTQFAPLRAASAQLHMPSCCRLATASSSLCNRWLTPLPRADRGRDAPYRCGCTLGPRIACMSAITDFASQCAAEGCPQH